MLLESDRRHRRTSTALPFVARRLFPIVLLLAGCENSLLDLFSGSAARRAMTPPTVTAPPDLTVECDGAGNLGTLRDWLGAATFTEGCGDAVLASDFATVTPGCAATTSITVTWIVADACNQTATDSATFTVIDTTAPVLTVPGPISVACGEPGTADALQAWLGSATASDVCGAAAIITTRSPTPGGCTATIQWTATDECGNAVSASSTYTITGDVTPPTMVLVGDAQITIECGADWDDPGVTLSDDCDALIRPMIAGQVDLHAPGAYTLTYEAADACGNAAPVLSRMVTVVDTTAPVVNASAPKELWPPNHALATLTLADLASVTDACEGELDINMVGRIIEIYSDEPDDDVGDGNTAGDIEISDDHTFAVRAERQGGANGRVYGVRFEVSDSSGNAAEATAFVHVPHDQSGQAAIDDGPAAGHIAMP